MSIKPLTAKQRQMFNYIFEFYAENKRPPCCREIGAATGRSKKCAWKMLNRIIDRGHLSLRNRQIQIEAI